MFQQACQTIRQAVYGVKCVTPIGDNMANISNGTGFMVAPGVLATAAHVIHFESNLNKAVHDKFQVIRAPDIGQRTEKTEFVADFIGVANIIRGEIIEDRDGTQKLLSNGMEISIPAEMQYTKGDNVLLVVRPELIKIGENAKRCSNSFSVEEDNILYKGACSVLYVHFDNGQEIRIRVESKGFRQDFFTANRLIIGWNEKDTVVLKREQNN